MQHDYIDIMSNRICINKCMKLFLTTLSKVSDLNRKEVLNPSPKNGNAKNELTLYKGPIKSVP